MRVRADEKLAFTNSQVCFRVRCGLVFALPIIGSLFPLQAAKAQEVERALEEVVVSARKRDESLQEVPLAITSFSADDIMRNGITTMEDISARAPGLFYSNMGSQRGGRSESVIRFRGMDVNDVTPVRQLASVFIDGIYVSGGVSSISMEDVERVEVIKGPQAAYFGRNTFGGAVNFISRQPGNEFGGNVLISAAQDSDYDLSGSVDIPIIDDVLAARISGRYYTRDGRWSSAADGGELGEEETQSLSLALRYTPSDSAEFVLRGFRSEDDDGLPPTFALDGSFHNCGPFGGGNASYICGSLPTVDDIGINTVLNETTRDIYLNNSRNSESLSREPDLNGMGLVREIERYSLNGSWDIPSTNLTISGSASYNSLKQKRLMDLDYTGENVWLEANFQDAEDSGFELRLTGEQGSRVSWLVGVSRFDLDFDTSAGASIGYLYPNAVFNNGFFLDQAVITDEVENIGVFGSVSVDLSDTVTFDFEVRYQEDEITTLSASDKFTNTLPRAILQWQPSDDLNLYVTYAEGNKPGNFNAQLLALTDEQREEVRQATGATEVVDEEELKNYEIGWKQSLFDGRANFALAAYFMEWTNQQTRTVAVISDPTTPAGVRTTPVIITAGETELWGLEAEGSVQITNELRLQGGFNWAASEYKVFECGFCANVLGTSDMSGNETPRFPKYSGNVNAEYYRPVGGGLDGFIRADWIYVGEAWTEAFNLAYTDDYSLFNFRVGIQADRWMGEIFVNNAFDEDVYWGASRFTDFTLGNFNLSNFVTNVSPAEPRQFGARISLNF